MGPPPRSRVRPRRSPPDPMHGWIILDRYAHSSDGDVGGDDVTAPEIAHTCSGRRIRVSLRVADPPAISRLYIHRLDVDDQPWPDAYDLHHAEVVDAHHGSILFWTRIPFADADFVAPGHFPVDYFVYTAGAAASSSPPSLTRLPPCFIDVFSDPVEDEYYKPYQRQRQRIMLDENIGFVSYSGDGGEFMVADIRNYYGNSLELCIFNHHAGSPSLSPSLEQWRIQRLEMHHASARKIGRRKKLCKWVNDVILTLHGRYLYCVDFYKGIRLIDTNNLQSFSYIPLPEEAMTHGRRIDEDEPDPAHRVSGRKRSETMQKAKQERTMHKIGRIERQKRIEMLRQEREKL